MLATVNPSVHSEVAGLAITYALFGAIAITVILAILSATGHIKLTNPNDRKRLFGVLIVELVAGLAILATGLLQVSPATAQRAIEEPLRQDNQRLIQSLTSSEAAAKTLAEEKETLARSLSESSDKLAQVALAKDQLQTRAEQAETELGTLKAALKELEDINRHMDPVGAEQLAAKIKDLQEQLTAKEAELAENKAVVAALIGAKAGAERAYEKVSRQLAEFKASITRILPEGRILAVQPGWNFVVMDLGDRQGIKAGAPFLVTRQGQLIAKLQTRNVEPTQSVADIVGGSVTKGEQIKPGDTVILAGQ
jgi:uncharacterized phage infection (PIP) family protein YhgE